MLQDPTLLLKEVGVTEGDRLLLTVVAAQQFHLEWDGLPAREWGLAELRKLLVDIGATTDLGTPRKYVRLSPTY